MSERVHSKTRTRALCGLTALGGFLALLAWRFLPRPREAARQPAAPAKEDHGERPKTAYETTDWSLGPVALIYLGVPVLLALSCFVLIAAYPGVLADVARTLRIAPPGPRLQTDTAGDLNRFRAAEENRLNSYYWIDKQKGVVHIPIQQAMQGLAKKGIPGFPKGQP